MNLRLPFFTNALFLLYALASASFSCSVSDPRCLGSFLNSSTIVNALTNENGNTYTQNGFGENSGCPAISVIFAKGTGEPGGTHGNTGNVGILAGPPFFNALVTYMGRGSRYLAIQGVNYSADIQGFLSGGSLQGASTLTSLITNSLSTCPSTSLILSGYSQGAQLVHLVASSLPPQTMAKISSIVLFGDPKNGTTLGGVEPFRVLKICHSDDDICGGGQNIGVAHLNYSADAGTAARFALQSVAEWGILS